MIRLTDEMIDTEQGVIVPTGGRIKTHVRQIAPLTVRVTEVLQEIAAERRRTKVRNVHGLVFTRANGKAITKDAITAIMRRVCRDAGVKNFRFHDLRHCAKTNWAKQGIGVDAAMLAAGHKSVQITSAMSTYRVGHCKSVRDSGKMFPRCSQGKSHRASASRK